MDDNRDFNEDSFEVISTLSDITDKNERRKIILDYIRTREQTNKLVVNEFSEDLQWFNVAEKLTLQKLSKKIVILDFFTYCCINCMHVLPDLEELEKYWKPTDGVVVLGVHSAKFDNEKDSSNISSAIIRYNINHAVVNDAEASMWKHLEINCWPTFVILGVDKVPMLALVGEGHKELLLEFVSVAHGYYKDQDRLSYDDLELCLHKDKLGSSPLLFPGKVSVRNEVVAISDTGHHQVILTSNTGVVQNRIGSGQSGLEDGDLASCCFNSPQGLCWNQTSTCLYVADTGNHAVRKIDLVKGSVETIAGTGSQGHDLEGGQSGQKQEISSPWDVTLGRSFDSEVEDVLLISMAGTHQIWVLFLEDATWLKGKKYEKGVCVRFAGSGNEENRNNSYPHNAAFAQPSGISLGSIIIKGEAVEHLFVADSESSSVRSVSLRDGAVKAMVGADRDPRNLFAFGDVDGKGVDAKLQHPLGVTVRNSTDGAEDTVLVADSYNHKIKVVDVRTRECSTVLGVSGLNEPGGVCMDNDADLLYIADTNNHKIKTYSFVADTLSEFPITEDSSPNESPTSPVTPPSVTVVDAREPQYEIVKSIVTRKAVHLNQVPIKARPGDTVYVEMDVDLEEGLHLTEGAPSVFQIVGKDFDMTDYLQQEVTPRKQFLREEDDTIEFRLLIRPADESAHHPGTLHVQVECVLYYCDDAGVCMMKCYVNNLRIEVVPERGGELPEGPATLKSTCVIGVRRDGRK